jgi:hypothetical protein
MEIWLTQSLSTRLSPRVCRVLAFGAWTLLGAGYVLGQFAFLGWVGPAPAFIYWSAAGIPLFVLTEIWLRGRARKPSSRVAVVAAVTWLTLLSVAFLDPIEKLQGAGPWAVFLGMLIFPLVLTYAVLARVEDGVRVNGTA